MREQIKQTLKSFYDQETEKFNNIKNLIIQTQSKCVSLDTIQEHFESNLKDLLVDKFLEIIKEVFYIEKDYKTEFKHFKLTDNFDNIFDTLEQNIFGLHDINRYNCFSIDYNIGKFKELMIRYESQNILKYTKNSLDISNLLTIEKNFKDEKVVEFLSLDRLKPIINFFKSLNAKHDLKLSIKSDDINKRENRTVNKEGHYLIDNKVKFKYLNNGTLKIIFDDSELFEIVKNILNN